MRNPDPLYAHALALVKSIKKMARSANYDSGEYRIRLDMLRDAMIDLAQNLEFGKLADLTQLSLDLLEPSGIRSSRSHHKLNTDDLVYHLQTFPTNLDALVNDISDNKQMNMVIVSSIVKSENVTKEGMGLEARDIARRLAAGNDKDAWMKLVDAPDNFETQYSLAAETIGLFNKAYLETHKNDFTAIAHVFDYKPGDFGWGSDENKIISEDLFDALKTIGCKHAIEHILKVCWFEFSQEYALQKSMRRYDFVPDEEYRRRLTQSAHHSKAHLTKLQHLATSFYLHELSQPEDLLPLKENLEPALLAEIFDLNGVETPYGSFTFLPKQIGSLLDDSLRLSLKDEEWSIVEKRYSDKVPVKYLNMSSIYKGNRISNDLGL